MTTPGAGEGERWEVSHAGGQAWWADKGNISLGGFDNRDIAAMVANNLNQLEQAREADQQTIAELRAELERSAIRGAMWAAKAGLATGLLIEILDSSYLLPANWAKRAAKQAKVHWDGEQGKYVDDEAHVIRVVDDEGGLT